ncbi:hypothetical protein [Tautonia plasticadhaerens]|uniref:Uncharacterized protein n=1 Tax=Tautonia plasticadhaerens TaxID=2527974 RepID=A0A518HBV1_9BACT|nr:hypothetical protein [Tautonia plasticadhaerens]QDV38331.1 hypothetical protein ElP_62830 [Tautonia plasticadhaerens]
MSTAGKVLSVLVTLMALVSIYLLAMVSQLNRSWGRGIESVSEQIEQVSQETRQAQADAYSIEQQVLSTRQATDAQLRSLRITLEDLQNRVSVLQESQLRLQLRLQEEQGLIAGMQQATADKEQEQARLQASLDEANARREQLAAENAEKLDRLQSLRQQFTTLLAENEELLDRVASRGAGPEPSDAESSD